jgi:16S rRNA (cytidine1402-2'-O)-methyltransferase
VAWPSGKAGACKASIPQFDSECHLYFIMLYIVATPIGNLEDITVRALNILKLCDYILCEDTRKSQILLNHYNIKKKLVSFHKFNEKKASIRVIDDLKKGSNIALISDAGTPVISDPGNDLVNKCIDNDIEYSSIPGPCSVINALCLCGFEKLPFQFIGFLQKKENEIKKQLKQMLFYDGISVFFETSKRIVKTLSIIDSICENADIFIAREMTKKFEESINGKPKQLLNHFKEKKPLGEMVVIIKNKKEDALLADEEIEDIIKYLQKEFDLPLKEAIKKISKLTKINKKEVYNKFNR